ncbi:MAG: IS1634 family transposase [Deltaproteobacteria bacterium]|jgi:transposase|nr:IS1634 family transposase [Deltaproteobacteria bacterium]
MTTIIKCKSGKYTYLYESTSFRDKNGKPKNIRKCVGRINPITGEENYHPEYLERVSGTDKQPVIDDDIPFYKADLKTARTQTYGVNYLLTNIANSIGLSDTLKFSVPDYHEHILALANYLVATEEPMMYCQYWLEKNSNIEVEGLSSQAISKLLLSITDDERMLFFKKWAEKCLEQEIIALDITSVSSYSELVNAVSWGYNRDAEKLPQVNICLLMGEKSGLPVFPLAYNGAIKDVSTLKTTLNTLLDLKLSNLTIVMDKGFASKKNIDFMLNNEDKIPFMLSIPVTMKFAQDLVQEERNSIDTPENTIAIGSDILRAVTRNKLWDNIHKIQAHIFYNATSTYTRRNELYGHISTLREMVLSGECDESHNSDIEKYLLIKKSSNSKSVISTKIKYDIIEKELSTTGWMVAISNFIKAPKEALQIYRNKDVVEKAFGKMKNFIDLGRLRVQSDTAMQNKMFISFISLILISCINNVMIENNFYIKWTMKELFKILQSCEAIYIRGQKILQPLTSSHKEIFLAFGFDLPE